MRVSLLRRRPTSLVEGLQQVAAGLVRDPRQFGPVAAQPGPPQRAAVLLQPGQLGRRGLGLRHAVDQLRVLLAQTRLAEMLHPSQRLCSLSPGEGGKQIGEILVRFTENICDVEE